MNNKGFMMAEVIVVSAIILVFLTGLYLSYNKLFSIYSTRINYYDSTTLYNLAYYRDMLIKNDKMNNTLNNAKGGVVNIFDNGRNSITKLSDNDNVFIIYNQKKAVDKNNFDNLNMTFLDYIDYLSTAIQYKTNYIMLMERCIDVDDCKYAYLEVYDGYET